MSKSYDEYVQQRSKRAERAAELHMGTLMSGSIVCACGWESGHYSYAADACDEHDKHVDAALGNRKFIVPLSPEEDEELRRELATFSPFDTQDPSLSGEDAEAVRELLDRPDVISLQDLLTEQMKDPEFATEFQKAQERMEAYREAYDAMDIVTAEIYNAPDGWGWTVYLNGDQYASEIVPEKSRKRAIKCIDKWTRKALKQK